MIRRSASPTAYDVIDSEPMVQPTSNACAGSPVAAAMPGDVQQRHEVVGRRHGQVVVGVAAQLRRCRPGRCSMIVAGGGVEALGPVGAAGRVGPTRCGAGCAPRCRCATISTPSSRSGASAAPSATWSAYDLVGVDRELHHRDVGVGEHVGEHRPGAVVEAPAVVDRARPDRAPRARRPPAASSGRPGAGYSNGEQLLGEAVEVVDGPRPRHRRDGGGVDVPVRRHDEDRRRRAVVTDDLLADRAPRLGVLVELERVHRAAVPEEDRRHRVAGSGVGGVHDGSSRSRCLRAQVYRTMSSSLRETARCDTERAHQGVLRGVQRG